MMGSILAGLAAITMAVMMPMFLLTPIEVEPEQPRFLIIEEEQMREDLTVRLKVGNEVRELLLEDYLIGVVMSEMPLSFEMEALKAQAVTARTFAFRQMGGGKHMDCDLCDQSSCCQAWVGKETMVAKLGNSWEQYRQKAETAVVSTEGIVLTYDNRLIEAVYFSCSGGATEAAVAVWGSEVPYLQSVESPGEEQAGKYLSEKTVSLDDFRRIILQAQPLADLHGQSKTWLGDVTCTDGGGVAEMEIGGTVFTGTQLRQLFSLNSTNFTLHEEEGNMVFSVKGYGHRVGMSQYGANAMAAEGKNYAEILKHYYEGVSITKWK